MLDKLKEKQLVHRDRSKTDQPSVHIYVSERGQEFLGKAPKPAQGKLSNALEQLTPSELTMLESGLNALVQALHFSDDQAGLMLILGE